MVSNLADSVGRILPFIKPVQEESIDDDIELLGEIIKKMYDLILDTAEFIGDYVRRSALSMSLLMRHTYTHNGIDRAWKSVISMEDRNRITALGEDMSKLETDFDRAIGVEALRTAKKNSKKTSYRLFTF